MRTFFKASIQIRRLQVNQQSEFSRLQARLNFANLKENTFKDKKKDDLSRLFYWLIAND